jgi:ABC-2 type transport system permease protein
MSTVLTIAKREVTSLFYSPIAYFVLFLFLVVTGFLFGLQVFVPGQLSEIRRFIDFSRFGLFFIIPGITMSVFADEYRSGRIEMLRTSPITEAQLVLGKYLGAAYFFLILVAVTLVFVGLLVIYGRPDWGMTAAAYVGLILLGLMFVSVGVFFSACTQNQIVAYLATLLTLAFFTFISELSMLVPAFIPLPMVNVPLRAPLYYIGVGPHIADFAKGVVDSSHLAYFGTFTLLFLFCTYLLLESRKWR